MSSRHQKTQLIRAEIEAQRDRLRAKNDKVTKLAGRNLVYAVSSGLLFGAIVAVALWVLPVLLLPLGLAIVVLCSLELVTAMRGFGLRVPRTGISVSGGALVLCAWFFDASAVLVGLAGVSAVLVIWRLLECLHPRHRAPLKSLLLDVFTGLFVLGYIAFPIAMALLMVRGDHGVWWLFAALVTAISVDTGAYISGVRFGKHKMAPRISPNKTWEGFIGAGIAALITACLVAVFGMHRPLWVGVLIAVTVLILATVGDLAESLIKRNLGVKDMSGYMPGHGGLLDRLDSILPSLVGVYGIALAVGAV